ncbi:MAG: sigma-70 family RNA polymerase sigma factor [Mucilaginibacter sp.]|uniref:RNA polymerase sigma factor n=1 Tax=Mucilaginibacter sp. TaxID=1882438 RepID=UPI0032637024
MSERFKETWQEFIGGSHDALDELYAQHYLGLINYGVKLTADRHYANDCIVEMLLSLWGKRDRLPSVDNVRSYLMTCLRTLIFQKIRADKLREAKENYASSLTAREELPYEEYITRLQSDAIIKAKLQQSLNKLTDRQKELLQYRFFENMDYDEISIKAGISKRTAYNIVYDALQKLRSDLSKEGANDLMYLMGLILISLSTIGAYLK